MRGKNLLFVCYGAGHIAMVLPVIRACLARWPDVHIDLLALTTAAHEARRQGFEPLGFRDFAHWYDEAALRRHAQPLLEQTRHPLIDEVETMAYLGINLEELNQRLGAGEAQRTFAEVGRWAFYPLDFMKRLLAHLKTDLVVTTNSPRSEQAAIEAAAALGVPSVCMVDLFSPAGDPFFGRSVYADAITTIGELGKRNLVAGGIDAARIHITGSPAFDSLFSDRHRLDAQADRKAMGWEGLHVILWAGHLELLPPGMGQVEDPAAFPREAEAALRAYVAARKDTALIIRYHPNHAVQFKAGSEGVPQERVLWSDAATRHAHRDIHLCDIAVIQATTVGLEAAIAGKSVISLDHTPSRHVFPCSEQGISRGVDSFAALPAALDRAIAEPFKSQLARDDANSAEQVTQVIAQLLARKPVAQRQGS
jgi:hypothetical protein